ncbi:proline dehydrogenase family protein [Rhodococcoides yunnanense]|uniref:proline dehydrogenase n=1 Tax=Rhodococcoides yunnanense TaxID=278209 RepID=A0ABU4BKU5_9NOCA|nr:proline dehydrogenase family protein [Rhodococcus yunnanensis]MDV6264853.1 proline dehydrogenase family protein [Rhodococcus yunnanensis]
MTTLLNNPLRPALLAAARSPKLQATVTRMRATRALVDRFVAGESEPAAVTAVDDLLASGRFVSVDYLGEDTIDRAQASATVESYLSLIERFSSRRSNTNALEVSLKLSALGQGIDRDLALENARRICLAAAAAGVWVTVDAEDHTTTDSTLSIVRELRVDFPDLGTVLQAYLRRTEADCAELSGPRSRIRLCKGAYNEPSSVAFQGAREVSDSYLRCLQVLMSGRGYPMVASHDPEMIEAAEKFASAAGRSSEDFEFQMLYGIRDQEQRRLVDADRHVRVYVPYGEQWYGYFMRRLAERPANLMFFARSLVSRK